MKEPGDKPLRSLEIPGELSLTIRGNSLVFADSEAQNDPVFLEAALKANRDIIRAGIEAFYEKTKAANPDAEVHRPSMTLVKIETAASEALTEIGTANRTGIHREIAEIDEKLHPLWSAIVSSGFAPELRSGMGEQAILFLRMPEQDDQTGPDLEHVQGAAPETVGRIDFNIDVLPSLLGLTKTDEMMHLEERIARITEDHETSDELIEMVTRYQEMLEQVVMIAHAGEQHQHLQLAALIVIANLKRDLGYFEEYVEDLEDARLVAEQLSIEEALIAIDSTIAEYEEMLSEA